MSNSPLMNPLQQTPAMVTGQQAYMDRPAHGSVGAVIGVLAVIVVLGAVAVIIGRLCSGGSIMGRGHYAFESWFETKCGSCVNGLMIELPERPVAAAAAENGGSGGPLPASEQEAAPQETKEEEDVGNQESAESTRKS
ncbi:PREDICTED: uncharacterized protein LOC109164857 [Ipomoea nil]|uniref:uncharacterized protein LOC109164857 n=1 Tax=Ipomoea nil TaxID=35883 RepID=UPI000900EC31|nr:PREDICTED: uncharacterized protein LOC109164857 [Ipomoea nil]